MAQYFWTSHAQWKMKYYGLSKQKVSGIIRRPDRIEKGIAGNGTIAVMQAVSPKTIDGKKVWKQEVWTMYQHPTSLKLRRGEAIKIISAWRYPGVSPKDKPIPEDIFQEMEECEANESDI
jgi:hypothetical protein